MNKGKISSNKNSLTPPELKNDDKYIDLGERGRLSKRNKLNELTGKEWIKFTKTWFIHRPKRRNEVEILHPAKYPESLIEEFILFFTKKGQYVLDPFAGTGSTNIAAQNTGRNCLSIEITKKYADIANRRIKNNSGFEFDGILFNETAMGDSIELVDIAKNNYPDLYKNKFDFCITSPPYWNQLKRNSLRQAQRKKNGLDTQYSFNPADIGNEDEYESFLKKQKKIFNNVYRLLKNNSYLVVITNNVYFESRLYPLAYDTFNSLIKGEYAWTGKDEKIWCQDDKALANLGVNNAWVGNRCHQFCLIFRKEASNGREGLPRNKVGGTISPEL